MYNADNMYRFLGPDGTDDDAQRFAAYLIVAGWELTLEDEQYVAHKDGDEMTEQEWQDAMNDCFDNDGDAERIAEAICDNIRLHGQKALDYYNADHDGHISQYCYGVWGVNPSIDLVARVDDRIAAWLTEYGDYVLRDGNWTEERV